MQPRSWKSCFSFCVVLGLFAFIATMFFAPESLSKSAGPASPESQLMSAAGDGDVHAVAEALRAGAEIHAMDPIGSTALMTACSAGHRDVVRYLLDQGAPINARGGHGFTALYFAVSRGDTSLVRLLLNRGADPNVVWREQLTPIETPEELQYEDVAKLLRERGAHRARHCASMTVVVR
jgi:ankyrin repeat protein